MKKELKIKIYFSDIFNVSNEQIKSYGAFNISLINDLPLFIDPFLIFNSDNEKLQELHRNIIKYVVFLKSKSKSNLSPGLIKSWFYFPEVKQNWFGFSKSGNGGNGLAGKFADSLKFGLSEKFTNFGEEQFGGSHLGKLSLVKKGVGKDNISDFTCNLIKGYLADYTSTFAQKHIDKKYLQEFMLDKVEFNYQTMTWKTKKYLLPKFNNDYVLLTPFEILTKDDAWISQNGLIEDFSQIVESVSNEQLRDQISHYFTDRLPLEKANKSDIREAAEKCLEKFPIIIDYYIKIQEKNKDAAKQDNLEKIQFAQSLFVNQLHELATLLNNSDFYNTPTNSYEEGMKRVNYLKHVIEKQNGYRLLYLSGKPIGKEEDLQLMFKLTWFATAYSFDSEVNNGRGPADFIVSYGSKDKSVIEFKLAKSTSLEKNLINQAEIYSDAARATRPPIKVIFYFSDKEYMKVKKFMIKHNLNECKDIVLIDAQFKESASKS